MLAAFIQGFIATLLAIMLAAFVISTPYPKYLISSILVDPSIGYMEISALAGLGLYFLIGVVGIGVTSYFYHYFEMHLDKNYKGLANVLAWLHILLINIGITCTSLLMIYAGYIGGYGCLSTGIWRLWHDSFANFREHFESICCSNWNYDIDYRHRCNLWRSRVYYGLY